MVEDVPWGNGKHTLTNVYMLFLARWARRLSRKETAEAFRTSWEKVFDAVEHVVTWGLEHRTLGQIDAIGVDKVSLAWIMRLTAPLFAVAGQEISGRDLIPILGGLFLLAKSTHEIHARLEGPESHGSSREAPTLRSVVVQILVLDLVFSLDSVITAVGMVEEIPVMVVAIIIAVPVMLVSVGAISRFVDRHPTVKMLTLSFLLLVGVALVAEGFEHHIPRGYIYFAIGFSVLVEMLNLRAAKAGTPVQLKETRPLAVEDRVTG